MTAIYFARVARQRVDWRLIDKNSGKDTFPFLMFLRDAAVVGTATLNTNGLGVWPRKDKNLLYWEVVPGSPPSLVFPLALCILLDSAAAAQMTSCLVAGPFPMLNASRAVWPCRTSQSSKRASHKELLKERVNWYQGCFVCEASGLIGSSLEEEEVQQVTVWDQASQETWVVNSQSELWAPQEICSPAAALAEWH